MIAISKIKRQRGGMDELLVDEKVSGLIKRLPSYHIHPEGSSFLSFCLWLFVNWGSDGSPTDDSPTDDIAF
jgi:hypothetical protein